MPDPELCGELVSEGATCKQPYSGVKREVPPAQWRVERKKRLSIRISDAEAMVAFIDDVCDNEKCNFAQLQRAKELKNTINELVYEMSVQ